MEPWLAVVMLVVAAYVVLVAFRDAGPSAFLAIPAVPEVGMTAGPTVVVREFGLPLAVIIFVSFLFLISALFVPVFAIMVVDHWILRRGRYATADLVVRRGGAFWYRSGVNPVAVGCFLVGAVAAFYWTRISPLPVGATLPTFAATFLLYLALGPLAARSAAARSAAARAVASPVLRIVDLSHPIENGMQVYPGDPVPSIGPAATLDRDGVNVLHVYVGSQTGTHVDAPYHFLADGARVDAVELPAFLAPATVVDVRGLAPRSAIPWERVAPHVQRLPAGSILVLHTGWSRYWCSPAYLDHPYLDEDTAGRIVAAGVRTVAVDALSVDETPPPGGDPGGFPAHHVLLGAGGVVVENLTNLEAVDFPDPLLSVLPIRLRDADGAPVRAVALQWGSAT